MTDNLLSTDPGRALLVSLVEVAQQKLERAKQPAYIANPLFEEDPDGQPPRIPNPEYMNMPASEMSAIIQLLRDNSVTLASIRRGDFGETIQRAEEDFPFQQSPRDGAPLQ